MVIKLTGIHSDCLFPTEKFKTGQYQKLGEHEQAILYNDENVENIVLRLKSFPDTKAIVYCSDHSYERTHEYKLTMFIYLSPALQDERPGVKKKIQELAANDFWIYHIYDLFLDLMNITVDK